jgi:predicted murein hydrolase (TIGR00659 family)
MNNRAAEIWVYLSASPLLWLTVTLIVYQLAQWLYTRCNQHALLNPVAVSIALLVAVLAITGTPYATFFDGAQFVHFLLGPATVALAIPLHAQLGKLKTLWLPVLAGIVIALLVGSLSALGIAALLDATPATQLSLAPKSVTAAVGMGIAEKIGGLPSLTAVLVIATGILGAVAGKPLFDLLGIKSDAIRGIAMGATSHGIGTARAFQISEEMGAFSGLAMGLSAGLTALLLPYLLRALGLI